MTQGLRKKIAYWFFMIVGMAGIVKQTIDFFNNTLDQSYFQGFVTMVCVVFILKPMILLSLVDDIIAIISKLKTNK